MDDVSVFRRFFVASSLLSEILSGLMGSVANGIMGGGEAPMSMADQTANFGKNPFVETTSNDSSNQNTPDTNDSYQFPSS